VLIVAGPGPGTAAGRRRAVRLHKKHPKKQNERSDELNQFNYKIGFRMWMSAQKITTGVDATLVAIFVVHRMFAWRSNIRKSTRIDFPF
jgi:hypothetical protein